MKLSYPISRESVIYLLGMVIHDNKQPCIPPVGDIGIKVLSIKIIYLTSFKHVELISESCPWKLN